MKTSAVRRELSLSARVEDHTLRDHLRQWVEAYLLPAGERRRMIEGAEELLTVLATLEGISLQGRWETFEANSWPGWGRGIERPSAWMYGVRTLVGSRVVRPGWSFLLGARVTDWFGRIPPEDPLKSELARFKRAINDVTWMTQRQRDMAYRLGIMILLRHGYERLEQISEANLQEVPSPCSKGMDALDVALCNLGILDRTPQRGSTRRNRKTRQSVEELVAAADMPERFKPVTTLYLETYSRRISSIYGTLRHKLIAVARFWRFIDENYPEVRSCAELTPRHARGFVPYQIEEARKVRRGDKDDGDRATAYSWLIEVRTFFADICTWATEEGSPFAEQAPATIPLTRHDLTDVGFEAARRRQRNRIKATILDLEREVPKLRAYSAQRWHTARREFEQNPKDPASEVEERKTFWDWAILELLLQSGIRIEEACELTTLDVLKRRVADGRIYYLLHIKPSKFDRARVIPVGDGLGRVIAEIVRHVKRFYESNSVPACDHWDGHEKRPRPRAPYLLQGITHPSAIGVQTIRDHLRRSSIGAGLRKADGSQLVLRPHDCRRMFASEHLNNDTPVHVIQALLGHATIGTVMVYAELYPRQLVESYRRSIRGTYGDLYGKDALRNPTREEWEAFSANCSMRDMGTHLCALPTGEHCPRGLVCLGCVHAQPKKSAASIFLGMLNSHNAALDRAREIREPPGQIAARELEINRIENALHRAQDLPADVATLIEQNSTDVDI